MTTLVPTILAILTHTPIWVWGLFALVLFLGYQRTRDRTVQLWRMLLFPVIMIVLAVTGMAGAGLGVLPAILVGVVVGGVSGWLLERDGATRRLPDGRMWLRGEWWSFAQIVADPRLPLCDGGDRRRQPGDGRRPGLPPRHDVRLEPAVGDDPRPDPGTAAGVLHRRAGRCIRHKRKGGSGPPFSVLEGRVSPWC